MGGEVNAVFLAGEFIFGFLTIFETILAIHVQVNLIICFLLGPGKLCYK